MCTCNVYVFNDKLSGCHEYLFCRVPYLAVAKTFERIEEESKRYGLHGRENVHSVAVGMCGLMCLAVCLLFCCRLKIIATLTNFFRSVIALSPEELVKCVYLCLNKVTSLL